MDKVSGQTVGSLLLQLNNPGRARARLRRRLLRPSVQAESVACLHRPGLRSRPGVRGVQLQLQAEGKGSGCIGGGGARIGQAGRTGCVLSGRRWALESIPNRSICIKTDPNSPLREGFDKEDSKQWPQARDEQEARRPSWS